MRKLTVFQNFLTLSFLSFLACSQVEAQTPKGNLSNDVILKNPRRSSVEAGPTVLLKSPQFQSKSSYLNNLPKAYIQTPGGKDIKIYLAINEQHQVQGLSGTRSHEFETDEGMLFFNLNDQPRSFWMPDTYFNLDIFFLSEDLRVLNIERNVPHHPGRENEEKIYKTGTYNCRHVLELKNSSLSKQIVTGSKFTWTSTPNQKQTELSIRQGR